MEPSDSNHWQPSVASNPLADSLPLKDVVVCCTSVPDEKRTELAAYAQQMGAIHRYDLTLDVTHLIVGHYDTDKYRYVAKERLDIRPMTIGWIEAVRELWIADQEIDVEALEREHTLPPLTSLKFSMTGCDDPTERLEIAEQVKANGAVYEGDLTKQISHLISFRTEGPKYKAARAWGLRIVSVEWLRDSLERGMILDETLYDPTLPPEERGKGAWNRTKPKRASLGKRSRDDNTATADGSKRKLRRTTSTKLGSQSEKLWGDIVRGGMVLQVARSGQWETTDENTAAPDDSPPRKEPKEAADPPTLPNTAEPSMKGFFNGCRFYFYGFTQPKSQILCSHLLPQDAEISSTLDEFLSPPNGSPMRLFRVVPSNLPVSEHPALPPSHIQINTITEWWVERCLHHKNLMDPGDHVIGRPFPLFPIPEFTDMIISSAAFSGIDLLHVTRAVELLGAKYSEDFTRHSSILLTKSTAGLRKDKLKGAQEWKIPIVDASWLWDSIESGTRLPLQKYRFRGPKRAGSVPKTSEKPSSRGRPQHERSKSDVANSVSRSENVPSRKPTTESPRTTELDNTAFISDDPVSAPVKQEVDSQNLLLGSNPTSDRSSTKIEPLSEMSPNSPTRTISTAPAPSDHPAPRPTEDISSAISDLLAKTKQKPSSVQPPQTETEGRKRGANRILGRAPSNLSTTSTPFSRGTSVDSTATHGNCVEHPPYSNSATSKTSTAAKGKQYEDKQIDTDELEQIEKFRHAANGDRVQEVDAQPPPTQLLYEDPESREYKERVMARMLGESVDERVKEKGRERVATIMDGWEVEERPRRRARPPTGGDASASRGLR